MLPSVERPKRNVPKKWDPDFVDLGSHSGATSTPKVEKRMSVDGSLPATPVVDEKSPPKKARRGRPSNAAAKSAEISESKEELTSDSIDDTHCDQRSEKMDYDNTRPVDDHNSGSRKTRPCDKNVCSKAAVKPCCFVAASDRCCGNGWTSRWYHISIGEHYCNDCFDMFYRSNKNGYTEFSRWKRLWSTNGITEANVKMFFVDCYLPFWIQCTLCSKWRQLPKDTNVTPEFIRSYTCGINASVTKNSETLKCESPEDKRVQECLEPQWINVLLAPPYMISSPAAPFLQNYYSDGVGMSASGFATTLGKSKQRRLSLSTESIDSGSDDESLSDVKKTSETSKSRNVNKLTVPIPGIPSYFRPFLQPDSPPHALSLPPDHMTSEEQTAFPQYAREQQMYLAIRNIVVALWTLNPKEALTFNLCVPHIICRGLVRIRCLQELPAILQFLTWKAVINTGVIQGSLKELCPPGIFKGSVLVIGAGPAGLSAARQLYNLGCQVTVLEARDRVGGRVCDDFSLGLCVSKGAQIVHGCTNNPIALLSHQTDNKLIEISDMCTLVHESGQVVNNQLDQYMDFHFNALLDNIDTWRKRKDRQDVCLHDKINEMHRLFMDETQLSFTSEEEGLLQFHLAYMEQACGAELCKVSSLHWDQNESFTQFEGAVCLAPDGYSRLMQQLGKGIDIRLNTQVSTVDYTGERIKVVTFGGSELSTDYVLVTVPLYILKKEVITFRPSLPEYKTNAIKQLGTGVLEKVAIQFDRRFWAKKTRGADMFGHVPGNSACRGLFIVFYDLTSRTSTGQKSEENIPGTLVTYLTGQSTQLVREKSDKELVDMCLVVLRKLFPEEKVSEPNSYLVTRWQDDPYAGMAYSYLPVGCTGSLYDDMAAPVLNKIFFAGEATNRNFPQTVTGAYMSGIREACRILDLQGPAIAITT